MFSTKRYKDIETASKKQQAEIQKFKSKSEKIVIRLSDYKMLSASLQYDLAKFEAEKDKLENEYGNWKDKEETSKITDEEEEHTKNKTPERRTSKKRKKENISNEKTPEITILIDVRNREVKGKNREASEQR